MSKLTIVLTKNKEGGLKEQKIYNDNNLLLFHILPKANFWERYEYDNDKLIKTINSNNITSVVTYNKNSKIIFTDGKESVVIEYDENGNCIKSIVHAANDCVNISTYEYDENNNSIHEHTELVYVTHDEKIEISNICNIYDNRNNLITSTNTVNNNLNTYEYDKNNNLIKYNKNNNTVCVHEYDDKNRRIHSINKIENIETFYEYIEL